MPKDLETICLKCLEKQPSRRYQTAGELTEDLERFLRDEPIRARPVSVAERAWRWTRRQRRGVALTLTAAVCTLVFATISLTAWFSYQQWQRGYIRILTDRPPIVAEILDHDSQAVTPPFAVPSSEPTAVAADDYQLRLSSDGRLSQTYGIGVLRGTKTSQYRLNLEDQILWPTLEVSRSFELVELEGAADVILLDDSGISRLRGGDAGGPVWKLALKSPDDAALKRVHGLLWPWNGPAGERDALDRRPWLVLPAPDLDNDDVGDLVIAAQHQAWLLGVSGQTGKVLWFADRGGDLQAGHTSQLAELQSTTVGSPTIIDDLW